MLFIDISRFNIPSCGTSTNIQLSNNKNTAQAFSEQNVPAFSYQDGRVFSEQDGPAFSDQDAPVFSNNIVPAFSSTAISTNEGHKDTSTDVNERESQRGRESENGSTKKADESEDEIMIVFDSQREAEQEPQNLESSEDKSDCAEELFICPMEGCGTVMNDAEVSFNIF